MTKTILIIDGGGKETALLVKSLYASSPAPEIRLMSYSEKAKARLVSSLPQLPSDAFVVASHFDSDILRFRVSGTDAIVYSPPVKQVGWINTAIVLIDTAKRTQRKTHFILCSNLHPQLDKFIDREERMRVEAYLVDSGIMYTILQTGIHMQDIDVTNIISSNQLRLPFPHSILQGFVDLNDVIVVIEKIIREPEVHNRATYQLVGWNYTYQEIANDIATFARQYIECVRVSDTDFLAMHPKHEQQAVKSLLQYCKNGGLPGNSNIIRWLLGHDPTPFILMLYRDYEAPSVSLP